MARPTITAPKQSDVITDQDGHPSELLRRQLELIAYRLSKIEQAAFNYTALTPGTATTVEIATALNSYMTTATET